MNKISQSQSLDWALKYCRKLSNLLFIYAGIMSVFRLIALAIYGSNFRIGTDLARSLWMGVRFDVVVLAYLCTPPVLALIFCLFWRQKFAYKQLINVSKHYLHWMFILICLLLAIDVGYYSYFQDHFNILVFGLIEDDTKALLLTFWKNYPIFWYFILFLSGFYLLRFFTHRTMSVEIPAPTHSESGTRTAAVFFALALVCIITFAARGSFGLFPLGEADTVVSNDPFLNHLSSNGIHALVRAFKLRKQQNSAWNGNMKMFGYSDAKQAFADYYQIPISQVPESPLDLFHHKTINNTWAEKTKPHVVLIMMESFGGHWLNYQSPTFNLLGKFAEHTQQDYFFRNFLPSANSTTGSLSSMMISSPQRPIGNFLTESEFLQVPFRSSPARIFAKAGYETHFIYGGNPGWRDMNKFARFQGFEHVEGEVDVEKKLGSLKERHDWGIFDEDLFQYIKLTLQEAKRPQMLLVMTTTNHPPYQVPSSFHAEDQIMPDELLKNLTADVMISQQRFKTYRYSMDSLGDLMSEIKSSPLAEKTIVAATGDHGFLLVHFKDSQLLQKWSVPFYLYLPAELKTEIAPYGLNSQSFAAHMNVMPTLYDLSLSKTDYDSIGYSLLDNKRPVFASHDSGLMAGPWGAVQIMGARETAYFDWKANPTDKYGELVGSQENDERKAMATRYRAMMSLLDFYFISEKKH